MEGDRLTRTRALPWVLRRAPAWLLLVAGAGLVVLGLLITTQPLASLWLLAVYTGISCILSGVVDLARPPETPRWWDRVAAALWILGGVAILVWLGYSIALLPIALAAVLVVGGAGSLVRVTRGRLSQRVLAGAWGLAQLAFGVLALLWPDITLLTIAVLFGLRTIVFGGALLWRGGREAARRPIHPTRAGSGSRGRWLDVVRWTAAVLVLALAGGAWWLSSSLRAGLPVIDAFYTPPSDLPDAPGALIRADAWPGAAPPGATVSRILYTTSDAGDGPAVASAIVVVPDDLPAGPRPVIVWNHGTTGIARDCAPSLMPDMFAIQGIPAVSEAIANGWVVVATDYSGQGAPGRFPYLVGQGEARSALDGVRAARQLDGLDLAEDVVVWGHSQGGHAALWTGLLAPEYAPELTVLGIAAISPAAEPLGLAEHLTEAPSSPMVSLAVSWVLIPYSQAYPDVRFDAYVRPSGRAIVYEMSQRCTSQPGLLASVLSGLGVSREVPSWAADLTSGPLRDRLEENTTIGPWPAPLLVAWGSADEVIAPVLQEEYVAELCAVGTDFTWEAYPGYGHLQIVKDGSAFIPLLVDWTAARIDGDPPPPATC